MQRKFRNAKKKGRFFMRSVFAVSFLCPMRAMTFPCSSSHISAKPEAIELLVQSRRLELRSGQWSVKESEKKKNRKENEKDNFSFFYCLSLCFRIVVPQSPIFSPA